MPLRRRHGHCCFYNRGIAWSGKGDNDRATADYIEAIRLDQNCAVAFHNRGIAIASEASAFNPHRHSGLGKRKDRRPGRRRRE
jgi:hypothetical protein